MLKVKDVLSERPIAKPYIENVSDSWIEKNKPQTLHFIVSFLTFRGVNESLSKPHVWGIVYLCSYAHVQAAVCGPLSSSLWSSSFWSLWSSGLSSMAGWTTQHSFWHTWVILPGQNWEKNIYITKWFDIKMKWQLMNPVYYLEVVLNLLVFHVNNSI